MGRRPLGHDPKSEGKTLTKKQKCGAVLVANGKTAEQVGSDPSVNVSPSTVRRWCMDKDFNKLVFEIQDEMIEEMKRSLAPAYIDGMRKALAVLDEQIQPVNPNTGKPNSEWIRSTAARELLTRGHALFDKTDDKAVQIVFAGMPKLGSPSTVEAIPVEAVPSDGSEEINRLLNE